MRAATLPTLLSARLLVGYLGERNQYGWWPTAFHEGSSRLFLEPVFSKTFRLAQYHGVLEAARRVHDEHLNVGSYHLFRLPEEIEQNFHLLLQQMGEEDFPAQGIRSQDAALASLRTLAGDAKGGGVGPSLIAPIDQLNAPQTVSSIAGAYLSAFMQSTQVYPYLSSYA